VVACEAAALRCALAMITVIDNYDSFTYNLVQYLWELGAEVRVYRNDEKSVAAVMAERPERILVSPGPCTPDQAGVSLELIRAAAAEGTPVLGVCLGHQSIGQAFGGVVERAQRLMHGKTSLIRHDGKGVFAGVPTPFTATRYHSLVVNARLPECLEATAWTTDLGELMGIRHKRLPIEGVQFHPESFLTEHGHALLRNFLAFDRAKEHA
jgi:anthranilate synthase/aminodeoxychorismate synthase-like glutamine amidotransferase